MTQKMKVSREVAVAIEAARKSRSDEALLTYHAEVILTGESFFAEKEIATLNQLSSYQLATILIVGYEVEMTPAEIINSKYQKAADERKKSEDDYRIQYLGGYQYGVQETLRVLEIIVEGVNDDGN